MHPLVLALNPSVDVEWRVERVCWEEKNQVIQERRWPGGKGVNVARWLQHLGSCPRLLLPLGGRTGREMAEGLRRWRIASRVMHLREPTRANVIVTTDGQGQLRFNPAGPTLSASEWKTLLRLTRRELNHASLLVLSGSLPRGVPSNAYAQLIELSKEAGVKTLVDCDGPAFSASLRACPFLVKPNHVELAQWLGKPLRSRRSICQAARRLSLKTGGWVLVSCGERGALLVNAEDGICFDSAGVSTAVVNTVGAGDAVMASVARRVIHETSPEEWLRWGVATGTAAVTCGAGVLPKLSAISRLASQVEVKRRRL